MADSEKRQRPGAKKRPDTGPVKKKVTVRNVGAKSAKTRAIKAGTGNNKAVPASKQSARIRRTTSTTGKVAKASDSSISRRSAASSSGTFKRKSSESSKSRRKSTGSHKAVKQNAKSSSDRRRGSDSSAKRKDFDSSGVRHAGGYKKGMGLASKFSIPVCVLILVAIGSWGFWVGREYQNNMMNEVKKSGVTQINLLVDIGKQMMTAKKNNPGAWPLVVGLLTQRELSTEFAHPLEKKILNFGYKNPAAVLSELENFRSRYAINERNKFTTVKDLVKALDAKNVEDAKNKVKKIKSSYKKYLVERRQAYFSGELGTGVFLDVKVSDPTWSGMSDAPIILFDASSLAKRINSYIKGRSLLEHFLKINLEKSIASTSGKPDSVPNEVLNAYIVDEKGFLVVSTSTSDKNTNIIFEPSKSNISQDIDINGKNIVPGDINIDWGYINIQEKATGSIVSSEPALNFTKVIKLGKGGRLGTAYLALSSKRIREQRRALQMVMGAIGIVAVFIAAVLCVFIARRVTSPVRTLIRDMDIVAQGDLTHQTIARSSDEIGLIASQFNVMTQKLFVAQAAEKEAQRIEDELERAREIQMGLLPAKIPQIKGLDIYATYHPAKEVGGDYYDFFPINKEHLGIIVADVSGKGIPGSMVMGTTRTILRFAAAGNTSASDTLARTNQVVAADIRRGMFVTAMYIVLNAKTHEMLVASAGHNPMALYRKETGEVELINPNGIALGFDKGPLFSRTIKEQRVSLKKGDLVVMYTDGVVEAMNSKSEEYTSERFYDFVKDNSQLGSKDFVNALLDDLNTHKGNAEQHDDITVVAFRAE